MKTFEYVKESEHPLESVKFVDLMQAYRMARFNDQADVIIKFEAVKKYINDNFKLK